MQIALVQEPRSRPEPLCTQESKYPLPLSSRTDSCHLPPAPQFQEQAVGQKLDLHFGVTPCPSRHEVPWLHGSLGGAPCPLVSPCWQLTLRMFWKLKHWHLQSHKPSFKGRVQSVKLASDKKLDLGALDLCYRGNLQKFQVGGISLSLNPYLMLNRRRATRELTYPWVVAFKGHQRICACYVITIVKENRIIPGN